MNVLLEYIFERVNVNHSLRDKCKINATINCAVLYTIAQSFFAAKLNGVRCCKLRSVKFYWGVS